MAPRTYRTLAACGLQVAPTAPSQSAHVMLWTVSTPNQAAVQPLYVW
jgi:hypothetical protein